MAAITRAPLLLLLLPLFLSAEASPAVAGPGQRRSLIVGGWSPIANLSDPNVIEIAKFAVAEHNKEANARLALIRVVKGETQLVSGVNYKLVIEAEDGGAVKRYEAIVWEKAWENFKKLISFKPL